MDVASGYSKQLTWASGQQVTVTEVSILGHYHPAFSVCPVGNPSVSTSVPVRQLHGMETVVACRTQSLCELGG